MILKRADAIAILDMFGWADEAGGLSSEAKALVSRIFCNFPELETERDTDGTLKYVFRS